MSSKAFVKQIDINNLFSFPKTWKTVLKAHTNIKQSVLKNGKDNPLFLSLFLAFHNGCYQNYPSEFWLYNQNKTGYIKVKLVMDPVLEERYGATVGIYLHISGTEMPTCTTTIKSNLGLTRHPDAIRTLFTDLNIPSCYTFVDDSRRDNIYDAYMRQPRHPAGRTSAVLDMIDTKRRTGEETLIIIDIRHISKVDVAKFQNQTNCQIIIVKPLSWTF